MRGQGAINVGPTPFGTLAAVFAPLVITWPAEPKVYIVLGCRLPAATHHLRRGYQGQRPSFADQAVHQKAALNNRPMSTSS